MSIPKIVVAVSFLLFGLIGGVGLWKKMAKPAKSIEQLPAIEAESAPLQKIEKRPQVIVSPSEAAKAPSAPPKDEFPNIDRIFQLFTSGQTRLPIVETLAYATTVPWLKGRPAWIADYASYYNTSRHFIARSLNGKADYFTQNVSAGSKFNVFRKDKNIEFYLLVDIARCKMGFYYLDLDTQERVLLKTYSVGLGHLDETAPSGIATPLGTFSLGNKIGIYKPGIMGYFQDEKKEMIQIFGTRWIPFEKEFGGATAPAKGYGIHGAPWIVQKSGELTERRDLIGKYDSDGCIRLVHEDMEELFSIVITKPTFVVIAKDFHEVKLPGTEVASPR